MSHNHKYFLFIKKKEGTEKQRNKTVEREKTDLSTEAIEKLDLTDIKDIYVLELVDEKDKKVFKETFKLTLGKNKDLKPVVDENYILKRLQTNLCIEILGEKEDKLNIIKDENLKI